VNDLEGKGSKNRGGFRGFASYSPYIVVDHLAISKHLSLVKEVVASKRFAVIIPTSGKHFDVLVSSLHAGFRGSGGRQSSTSPPAPDSSGR
jgi:hypothetical protein